MDRPPCLGTAVAVVERRSVLAERCRGIGAALAPHIINVVRLIVQMGSAVAEQAANKGVRVAGGIREGRPRCGRNKGGRPRCGRNKEGRPCCGRNNEGRSVAGGSERPFFATGARLS